MLYILYIYNNISTIETLYIEDLQSQSKITVKKCVELTLMFEYLWHFIFFLAICSVSCEFCLYLDYKYTLD